MRMYTNQKGDLNGEFRSYAIVISGRYHFLPVFIEVFLLEELSFRSSLSDTVSSKGCEKPNQTIFRETQNFKFVRYWYVLHMYH